METVRDMFQTPKLRRSRVIWPSAVLLVASIVGIVWVVAPRLTKQIALPNQLLPAQAAPPAADSLSARLDSAEQTLNGWQTERSGLADRISQIDKSLSAGIRRARAETTALVEGVKRDVGRSFEAVHSRLTGVESTQREAHDEIARLQSDLAAVRRDLEVAREASAQQATKVNEIEQRELSTKSELSGMQNRAMSNQRRVDALSYQVERQNVGFEVSKNRTEEVVPGIYLTINRTNVAKQHVDGWVQIASDGRFVWLQDAGAQHPISLSSRGDERLYHLVITRITDRSIAGYILVPAKQESAELQQTEGFKEPADLVNV